MQSPQIQQAKDPCQIDNIQTHDVRYFAMLNNAVAILGDKNLEGGIFINALAYYHYLLTIQIPNCPASLNLVGPDSIQLNESQWQLLTKHINNLIKMYAHIEERFSHNSLYTKEGLKSVISTIDKICIEDNLGYLPSGYSNKEEVGHFIGLKARKLKNGHYAFSCINHGDGMRYHQDISISGGKVKKSYESDEYEVDLDSEEGQEFLQRVLELRFDSQQTPDSKRITNIYSADDLYGLLKVYGKTLPSLPPEKMKEKKVTQQRSGTCLITNTHAMARDSLINNNTTVSQRKRYHFIIKLRSLIAAFNEYRKGNSNYNIPIMAWALDEFSVRLNKSYRTIISDEEMIYCSQLQAQIKEQLSRDKEVAIKEKCNPKPYPNLAGAAPKYNPQIYDISAVSTDDKKQLPEESIKLEKKISKNDIKPEYIKDLLKIEGKKESFIFNKMYDLFNVLPHCSGAHEDEFWDKVPQKDITKIISNLYTIIQQLKLKSSDSLQQHARAFALALIAYDIVAQLAPRCQEFKLGNNFTLGLDDVYSEESFFTDPIAYHTVKRIAKNFELRAENKQRVFTNAVKYDNNHYDHTVNYVVNILLNYDQRQAVIKECSEPNKKPSDEQIFEYLMEHLDIKDDKQNFVLTKSVVELIAISATAHAVGNFTKKYKKIDRLLGFAENKFHRELQRKSQLEALKTEENSWKIDEIFKHLPKIERSTNEHKDYAENTIYHPYSNLLKIREDTYTRNILPYQPQLSGSIQPSSKVWQPESNQQFLYERLNEDLRLIECAPNFQIVKAFDWALNNLDMLRNKDVRVRINELCFQYGKLDNAFANELAATMLNMQYFFSGLLKYCREEAVDDTELIIWATNLVNNLRYHLEVSAKLYHLPIDQYILPSFKELLLYKIQNERDADVRSRFASQLICSYRNVRPLTLDDWCLLLICRVAANVGNEASASDEIWQSMNHDMIPALINNSGEVTKKLNDLLSSYNILTAKEWTLTGFELQASDTNFYIDLTTGALREKGEPKFKKERTEKTIADNKELFVSLHLASSDNKFQLLYSDSSRLEKKMLKSADGKWEFTYYLGGDTATKFLIDTTYQTINIAGINKKYKLLKKEEVIKFFDKNNPFESDNYAGSHYQYWQSLEDSDLVFVNHKDENVAYSYAKEYEIILISPDSEEDLELEKLQAISKANNNNPILIKYKSKISLYGFSDNFWKLTELNNLEFLKAVNKLTFPPKKVISLELLNKYEMIKQKQIEEKGSCDEFVEEMIAIEKKDIEKKKKIAVTTLKSTTIDKVIHQEIIKIHTPQKNNVMMQLTISNDVSREWQQSGKALLNFIQPKTILEQQWAARLGPMFGTANIRCTASLSADNATWGVESIEHLALALSFKVNAKQQLMCNEEPGYHLADQTSLAALNGLPNVIILQNEQNQKKYLIPAYSLKQGEKNNVFRHEDIIDFETLCNASEPYYTYTLNEHNELVTESTAGNLYLAMIYRSIGDFARAIKYLDRCKKHENIDDKIAAIASQVMLRKIDSPISAGFNLKLACYIKEHQLKWSKDENVISPTYLKPWDDFIKSQFSFYQKTFSSYKEGISIIPSYARLTRHELNLLQLTNADLVIQAPPDKRMERAAKLDKGFLTSEGYCARFVDIKLKYINTESIPDKLPTTLRQYGKPDFAFLYLVKNFSNLFLDAISNEATRLSHFNKTLFALLQNDANPKVEFYPLFTLLVMARECPHYFKNFTAPTNNLECITKVGEIFYQHSKEIDDNSYYLFTYDANPYPLVTDKSVASDFVPEAVKFEIAQIKHEQECKQPLATITERYFTKKYEAVAQQNFKLAQSGLPDATPLEKKLLGRLKEGHEKNKSKMKYVYSIKFIDKLSTIKAELEQLRQADEKKIKQLYSSLLKKANLLWPLEDNNATSNEKAKAYNLLQAIASGQKQRIEISDLFSSFLQKDPTILTEKNYFLKQQDIEQLYAELADYALLHSRVDQIKQAQQMVTDKNDFSELPNYQQQLLAGILDKTRAYDISKYPEFLVYEYATHRILREDQVEILIQLIELIESKSGDIHQAILQFAAGGGKTSVLIPILAQRFASKGLLPVIINTPELYKIGLDDIPKNLRESFQKNIEVIDRELDYKWTINDFTKLLNDLQSWLTEGKCLLIKSVTWHSINITMKSAYMDKNFELANAAHKVLNFFKTNSVKLEDECHLVSDPLQQSIKTEGKPQKIPRDQLDLLMHCYDYLMGREAKTSGIERLAGIKSKSNSKRSISPDELVLLQKNLAELLVEEDSFKSIPREDLINYLLPKDKNDKTRPPWLEELHNSKNEKMQQMADLIVLARAFIYTHLPHILSLQYLKDYGTSIHQGDLTVAPKQEGNNVSSHFGDHTLVAALTIQFYEQRGLLPEQVYQLLEQLIKEHKQERLWNYDFSKPTQAEQWLIDIFPSLNSIKELTAEKISMLMNDESIKKNTKMIIKYLHEFALPQIQASPKRITSTAAEMQAGFQRSILFSATPSLPEIYPAFLEKCFLEESFEAQVIDTLLQQQNKEWQMIMKPMQTPTDFFEQFPPALLSRMTTLIDRGSLLTSFDAKNIIQSYLGLDKNRLPTQVAAFFSKSKGHVKQQLKLKSKSSNIKNTKISGTALADELKKQGVNPESFLLFLFLDLSKTTGTDIKRPYTDHAGLTVGKGQTVTEIIQAAMRERQLLDKDAQSITWLMFQALYREINPCALISIPSISPQNIDFNNLSINSNIAYVCTNDKLLYVNRVTKECIEVPITLEQLTKFKDAMKPTNEGRMLSENELIEITKITKHTLPEFFDARQIFYWMIRNEAKEIEAKLINRAYQGIEQAISELAWQEIQNNPQSIAIYEKALEERQELSPYLIYELPSKIDTTAAVLTRRVDELLQKFSFKKEDLPGPTISRINKIIQETGQLIAELPDTPKSQLGVEVQQELQKEQKEELQLQQHEHVKNRNDSMSDFELAVETYTSQEDSLAIIFNINDFKPRYQILQLPGCEGIRQPKLLFCAEHFKVTQQKITESQLMELKPISNLLVRIMPDNQMQFIACTAAGIEHYAEEINKNKLTDKYPAYAIISTHGSIFRKSNNISIAELRQLIDSEDCQKMLTYTHFLNGEISNPIILSQIVKEQGWNKASYERLVNAIVNVHVSQQPVSLLKNEILESYCGWNNKKPQTVMRSGTTCSQAVEERIAKEVPQTLRPVEVLENHIEATSWPTASPKHALGNDLLGLPLEPICKNSVELATVFQETRLHH